MTSQLQGKENEWCGCMVNQALQKTHFRIQTHGHVDDIVGQHESKPHLSSVQQRADLLLLSGISVLAFPSSDQPSS